MDFVAALFSEQNCRLRFFILKLSSKEVFSKYNYGVDIKWGVCKVAHLIYQASFLCCYITSAHSHSTNTSYTSAVLHLQPEVPLSAACFSHGLLRSTPVLIIDWPSTSTDHDLSIISSFLDSGIKQCFFSIVKPPLLNSSFYTCKL